MFPWTCTGHAEHEQFTLVWREHSINMSLTLTCDDENVMMKASGLVLTECDITSCLSLSRYLWCKSGSTADKPFLWLTSVVRLVDRLNRLSSDWLIKSLFFCCVMTVNFNEAVYFSGNFKHCFMFCFQASWKKDLYFDKQRRRWVERVLCSDRLKMDP